MDPLRHLTPQSRALHDLRTIKLLLSGFSVRHGNALGLKGAQALSDARQKLEELERELAS
jgi:hypothetical protein